MNSFTFLPIICRLFSYWRNTPGVLCPNNINEINFNFLLSQAIDARQILTVNIKQKKMETLNRQTMNIDIKTKIKAIKNKIEHHIEQKD